METKFKTKFASIKAEQETLIKECLNTIAEIVRSYGTLAFGNTELAVIDDEPRIKVGSRWIALYSEDGYEKADDIANWADVVTDVDACYKSGRTSYSVMWNR